MDDTMKTVAISFSGKDSTLALHDLLNAKKYDVKLLFSTITEGVNRTSIHGVREELLEAQAESIGLPLHKIRIPEECSNDLYGEIMIRELEAMKKLGINHIAFGDLFLEDVRSYREQMLKSTGMTPIFPLWGQDTMELIERFLALGYRTVTTCVDLTRLNESFSGRELNQDFLKELPAEVDPCGENGEFHTFVFDGPIFKKPISFKIGEKKFANDFYTGETRFCFTDLSPVERKGLNT